MGHVRGIRHTGKRTDASEHGTAGGNRRYPALGKGGLPSDGKSGWDAARLQLKELVSLGLAYRFEK